MHTVNEALFEKRPFLNKMRPGLLNWAILNICFLIEAKMKHSYLPDNLLISVSLQLIYIVDLLWTNVSDYI
jgi:hypothetical protein